MKQLYVLAFLTFVTLACLSVPTKAIGLEYYGIQDLIRGDLTTETTIGLQFESPISNLDFNLDFNVFNLTTKANFDSADCTVLNSDDKSSISCNFVGMTEENNFLTLNFESSGRVSKTEDGYRFISNYDISVHVNESFVIIKLPENSVLMREVANESYSPGYGKTGSDGKHITVHWEKNDLMSGDSLEFSILYTMPFGGSLFNILIVSMTGVVLIVMTGLAVYIRRGGHSEPSTTKEDVVSSVLTSDEKTIVDILKNNEGNVMQRIIVRDTVFSKAKVSRLVKSLSERGILEIEPMGRTNKIKLSINKEKETGVSESTDSTNGTGASTMDSTDTKGAPESSV
jgi:hypothetical protein